MKKQLVIVAMVMLFQYNVFPQQNAHDGQWYSPYGEIRMFVVFADVVDDTNTSHVPFWNSGCLPEYADEIIDDYATENFTSYISKYFSEASFGAFRVTGDYYPNLIELNNNNIRRNGLDEVVEYLNQLPGNDIVTHNGHHLIDFDRWSVNNPRDYYPKYNIPDNKLDMLVIVWRHNSKYRASRTGGSCKIPYSETYPLKSFSNINGYAMIYYDEPSKVLRHEFGHTLIGGNKYHTGGAGTQAVGHFLPNVGGYSILSSFNHNLESYNGWDRWRLGWKHPNKNFNISTLDIHGNEISTEIVYNSSMPTTDYILRNFAITGDAIRIKLPHLRTFNSKIRNQYLWIENHQITPETIEYEEGKPSGIRFNIQVGNDSLTTGLNDSRSNYFVPLSSFGNYDFTYDTMNVPEGVSYLDYYNAYSCCTMQNPFEGHHPAMLPAIDYDNDNAIKAKEFITIWKIYMDDIIQLDNHPVFGNRYDAFPVGSKIGISSNPPTTPLMTYCTGERKPNTPTGEPSNDDNRYIWLNGLSVEIMEQYENGNIRVRVSFNDYNIDSNVRWCGPIMLTEEIKLQTSRTITLDYGITPTRPNNPVIVNDEKVFNSPTIFTCLENSYFKQEAYSTVNVINKSTLVLDSGSVYEVNDHAALNIEQSGTLVVRSGATLHVKGAGHVEVKNGAYICVENGANVILEDTLSALNLRPGCHTTLDSTVNGNLNCNCIVTPSVCTASNGIIHDAYNGNRCIQNVIYTNDAYETGDAIKAGYDVCPEHPFGDVNVTNGAHVIIDAEGDVTLDNRVCVELGSSLEVR